MTGRGGRDRFRRDYTSRSDEKSQPGRGSAFPSRHLWVGNISQNTSEATLCSHFLRFGELENVAFQPGRCYAFINFEKEEEAIAAMKGLQGFHVAGLPLKIEFAKEKSLLSLRDEDYVQRRDEHRLAVRGSPLLQRDSRVRHGSPEQLYSDNLKMDDTDEEPSEVLWIGFPAMLKVDEMILRKAFSPFGEVEKITVFPGRSYAFVQFRSVMAACRAKETLKGKLFGNPRAHICFSKSERSKPTSGRGSMDVPRSPHFKPAGRLGSPDDFLEDRNFRGFARDLGFRSPRLGSNLEFGDSDVGARRRKDNLWTAGSSSFGQRRRRELSLEHGLSEGIFEHRSNFSSQKYPQKSPLYEDSWDLPEDPFLLHGSKKLKTESFPPENELPDYPFSDFPRPETADPKTDTVSIGYKRFLDRPTNSAGALGERSSHWTASADDYRPGFGSLPPNPVDGKSSSHEWKWEGVIAKGGTAICRARCFPVGKALDVNLPEFLDCTARTSLHMLAKHYYQAAGAWVVFFVPETDADIGFYNEFMHYLEEKQRAAVARLDDKTTVFLVPPSDFSQNVLKVPGKLSISGVVLKLETSGSFVGHHQPEADAAQLKQPSPSLGGSSYTHDPRNENMQGYVFPQSNTDSKTGHEYPIQYTPSSNYYTAEASGLPLQETRASASLSAAAPLASALLGQLRQAGGSSLQQTITLNQSENQASAELLASQLGRVQSQQQLAQQSLPQFDQQLQVGGKQEEEADPQKRLQATLQLAAALLQQIQQGKGT